MKRVITLIVALCLLLGVTGCSFSAEKEYTLGLGIIPSIATNTKETAQFDATVAVVALNEDGRIVKCKIDAIQNKVAIKGGVLDSQAFNSTFLTKQEKGDSYGMAAASGIGKDWYQQADHFASYVAGMTVDQVAAIATKPNDYGSPVAADDAILSGCTIAIPDFISAVVEACNDKNYKSFKASELKLGIAARTSLDESSASATVDLEGKVVFNVDVSAVATDSSNKIHAAIVDTIVPEISFNSLGEVTVKEGVNLFSKRESGSAYGMKTESSIGKEWFEQTNAFEDYVIGLDAVGINSIKTEKGDNGIVAAEDDLKAGCTIAVDGLMAVLQKAINLADMGSKS